MIEAVDLGAENDERMARLREALALGQGFQLVIVQVEPGEQREEVLRRLAGWSGRRGVPALELVRLAPGESPVMRLAGAHSGVVLVGLEAEGDDRDERTRAMLVELNWSRDRLPELVPGPLVLVASQRVQTALFEQAPDFYSWRAHSTSIAPEPREPVAGMPWVAHDLDDPSSVEALIADATSHGAVPQRELAQLHARLALAHAVRGEFVAAEAALDTAQEGVCRAGTVNDRVNFWLLRSAIAERGDRMDEAGSWFERAWQEAGSNTLDLPTGAHLLAARARIALHRGDEAAMFEVQRAIPVIQALEDRGLEATLVSAQASLAFRRGETQVAAALLERALILFRESGDPTSEAGSWMMLASVAAAAGRSDEAERYGREAVTRAEVGGSADMIARASATLGQVALANDHLELADEMLRREVEPAGLGARGHLAEARAQLALRRNDLAGAEHHLRTALEAYRRDGSISAVTRVSLALGTLGRLTRNWVLAATGFETAERLGDAAQRAVAVFELAELSHDRGERSAALAEQYAVAARMLASTGDATRADTARARRGAVLMALGRDQEARAELETAHAGFETRGQAERAEQVRGLLARIEDREGRR